MTPEQRSAIAKEIQLCGFIYNREIKREVLTMLIDTLVDLPFEEVLQAFQIYRNDPANKFFPNPAQIRAIILPEPSRDVVANEIAARIREAITRFGHMGGGEAKDFLGEGGWRIVLRFGGWVYLCENLGLGIDVGTFYSQVRELAKAHVELDRAGVLDQPIELNNNSAKQINSMVKQLAEAKSIKEIE